jgi:hypothetical protein
MDSTLHHRTGEQRLRNGEGGVGVALRYSKGIDGVQLCKPSQKAAQLSILDTNRSFHALFYGLETQNVKGLNFTHIPNCQRGKGQA